MTYKDACRMIEESSWFREITERNYPAARLVALSRPAFETELQRIIDRHLRQKVHVDAIKQLCCIKV